MADGKRLWTRRRVLAVLGLVLAVGVVVRIVTWRNPGVIVSPETTFITAPLREDGTVDYAAAINERSSQGVTPENNAAVLLLQAIGPDATMGPYRGRFFEMLGIDPLPENAPNFETFYDYFNRNMRRAEKRGSGPEPAYSHQTQEALDRIMSRPWTKADSPIAAAWLAENERQINLV